MIVLTSPNELKNKKVKLALGGLAVSENLPFDFLLLTERGPIPVERKKFPSDFLASVEDGRFSSECAAMRDMSEFCFVIAEGKPRYKNNRLMRGRRTTRYNRAGFRNLCRSLEFVEGCKIEWSSDTIDTVEILKELQGYFDKEKHLSFKARPKLHTAWHELGPTYEQRFLFWLQGCGAGIGPANAIVLAKKFNTPQDLHNAEIHDIIECRGVGQTLATSIYNFLRGIQ